MITLETLKFLQSQAGFELLEELKTADLSEANTLKLLTQLRKRHSPENAAAALETARLRVKAKEKYLRKYMTHLNVGDLLFTSEALEQASHWAVGEVHADLIRDSVGEGYCVVDLGCGIGADTGWISQYYMHVIGMDIDLLRLKIARWNTKHHVDDINFIQADITKPLPLSLMEQRSFRPIRAAFFDPARRKNDRRIFSLNDYLPPLSLIDQWSFEVILVKLSPGIDLKELEQFDGTLQFISVDGELKEALLIRGGPFDNGKIRAFVRSSGHKLNYATAVLEFANLPALAIREPRGYLYEPDPAIIRAGLLSELAQHLHIEMYRLDEDIAYLTSDVLKTDFRIPGVARAWIIDDWMPFNLKKLRAYLRERNVGRVTVKKRGSPITPEELIAQLKLSGDGEERVVVLTHVMGQPAVLICRTIDRT